MTAMRSSYNLIELFFKSCLVVVCLLPVIINGFSTQKLMLLNISKNKNSFRLMLCVGIEDKP